MKNNIKKRYSGDCAYEVAIDIHNHTSRHSPCSIISPTELINEAVAAGLDGIAITEHGYCWREDELNDLKESSDSDIIIIGGMEVDTDCGHHLVFGADLGSDIPYELENLIPAVHEKGGIVIAAHPFRFSDFSGVTPEEFTGLFRDRDAVEFFNRNQTDEQNSLAADIYRETDITGTGGSDSHSEGMVGNCVTLFDSSVKDVRDMIRALKEGRCRPVKL